MGDRLKSDFWSVSLASFALCGEGGIGYCADHVGLLRLTPFPTARRRGPCKETFRKKLINQPFCFSCLRLYAGLCHRHKKQKVSITRHLLASFALCGEGGIRTPGTVARSPHFECGPIDHSGTSPSFAVQIYELFFKMSPLNPLFLRIKQQIYCKKGTQIAKKLAAVYSTHALNTSTLLQLSTLCNNCRIEFLVV